jgi:HK97 gp10 family phage protein
VDIKMEPGWEQHLEPGTEEFLKKVADLVLKDAKDRVPVKTGRLRDSLIAEVSGNEAQVGSRDVDYAEDVELGTAHQHPEPYLKPALYKQRTVS